MAETDVIVLVEKCEIVFVELHVIVLAGRTEPVKTEIVLAGLLLLAVSLILAVVALLLKLD